MGSFEDERILKMAAEWLAASPTAKGDCDGCGDAGPTRADLTVGIVRGEVGALCRRCIAKATVPVQTPTDKHGRELRAGDLAAYTGIPLRIVRAFEVTNSSVRDVEATVRHRDGRESGFWHTSAPLLWEILSRGLPADPVPESFEPERDAEGRPVLDARCPGLGDARTVKPELCDFSGRATRRLASGVEVFECWEQRTEPPSLASRYAAFRATVERVVAEEAPAAMVVTDIGRWTERDGSVGGETFIAWIDGGGWQTDIGVRADGSEERLRTLLLERLGDIRTVLGARAMGRK